MKSIIFLKTRESKPPKTVPNRKCGLLTNQEDIAV